MLVDKKKKIHSNDVNVKNEHLEKYIEFLNSNQDHYINLSDGDLTISHDKKNEVDQELVSWFSKQDEQKSQGSGTTFNPLEGKVDKTANYIDNKNSSHLERTFDSRNEKARVTDDLINIYQIDNLAKPTALFKIIYKDLSTKYFFTFMLFVFIFCTGLIKIYLTYISTVTTTEYAQLQADYKKLSYYNSNLQLEYLYLTSDAHIRSILNQDAQRFLFLPIVNTREVIVVIPYNTYYSKLIRNQIDSDK